MNGVYEKRFDIDLARGEVSEEWLDNCFTGKETIEVKTDFTTRRTGNVAVEVYSRGKTSGLVTTKSNYWFQVIEGTESGFWLPTDKLRFILKEWVEENSMSCTWGGDNNTSFMIIMPLKELLERTFTAHA